MNEVVMHQLRAHPYIYVLESLEEFSTHGPSLFIEGFASMCA